MRGFLSCTISSSYVTGLGYYQRAIDVLLWGRNEWKDVPKHERGIIFEETFVVGIKRLLLSAALSVSLST
jgi:hypothetical protein